MADNFFRPSSLIVVGSGLAGPQVLTTSGQRVDHGAGAVLFGVRWNYDGTASSGYVPAGQNMGSAGAQGLVDATKGTTSPLRGGAPAGQFSVQGSMDGVYYDELPVAVSGLYGVSVSGSRIIGVSGPMPDYMRLVYTNTASSGVFDVAFSQRSFAG